jgi:hypothetical protein
MARVRTGDLEMFKCVTTTLTALALTAGWPLSVSAHHSFAAEFDASKVVHLEGTVVQFSWVNPHSWIYMDVKKPDGTLEHWKIEGGAPSLLLRRGWNKNSVQAGVKVIVNAYQARDGSLRASARDVTFPDGKTLDAASSYQQQQESK